MTIIADRSACIGSGMCVLTAPDVFDQDDEGLVVLLTAEPADAAAQAYVNLATMLAERFE